MFDSPRSHQKHPDTHRVNELITSPSSEGRYHADLKPLRRRTVEDGLTMGAALSQCHDLIPSSADQAGDTCSEILNSPEFLRQYRLLKANIDHELERFRLEEGAHLSEKSPLYLIGMPGINVLVSRAMHLGLLKEVYIRVAKHGYAPALKRIGDQYFDLEDEHYKRLARRALLSFFQTDVEQDTPPISLFLSKLITVRGQGNPNRLIHEFCSRSIVGNDVYEASRASSDSQMLNKNISSKKFSQKELLAFENFAQCIAIQVQGYFLATSHATPNSSSEDAMIYDLAYREGELLRAEDDKTITQFDTKMQEKQALRHHAQTSQNFIERDQTMRYLRAQQRVTELEQALMRAQSSNGEFVEQTPPIDRSRLEQAKSDLAEVAQEISRTSLFSVLRIMLGKKREALQQDVAQYEREIQQQEEEQRRVAKKHIQTVEQNLKEARLDMENARLAFGTITQHFESVRHEPEKPFTKYGHEIRSVRELLREK